jgi:hypothetical protein
MDGDDSVNPRTANLDAQYALWWGQPISPNTLEVLTITPEFCRCRIGRKARTPSTTPPKLTSITHSSSSTAPSATGWEVVTPALLKTIPSGAGAHSATSAANVI